MSTPIPEAFRATEKNPVAAFDIEAWRSGRKTPTRVIPVTNDPGAGLRLAELQERELKIRTGHAEAQAEGRKVPGKRAGSTTTAELEALKDEIRVILAELDGTWSYITVRALTPREANRVADTKENRIDKIAAALAVTATISANRDGPGETLDEDGWSGVLETIGVQQTLSVENAMSELTDAVVTPDFSRRVYDVLDPPGSSSN